ncbi:MAG: aminotransferase class I/II-fold pyridoxal phosphate-dependent enzyme [Clostridia bacterium]|nr:aminotransferase class I/II-fold pyridoxal phosphate-dependent enzyme [Clostridia bacterium]
MELKISNLIKNEELNNYANGKKLNYKTLIDCSDGKNPYGCSKNILQILNKINMEDITDYSHDNKFKEEIAKYWNIKTNNIVLYDGSIEGLCAVNLLFRTANPKLLTFIPHFPDFSNYSKIMGYEHKKILLNRENNYKYDIDEMIRNIDDFVNVIYIDTPNNPTGQILNKVEAIKLIEYAEKRGIGVIIDEAYGDYVAKEESCIDLVNKYNNLLVIRTFSKGFGLAGLRAGYVISNEKVCSYLEKISSPYNISLISKKLAISAIKDIKFLEDCMKKIEKNKIELSKAIQGKLRMAVTHKSASICLLYSDNDIDLCQKFAEYGIKVYSGNSFEGLGRNSVRLNLPCEEKMEKLLELIKKFEI